MAQAFSSQHTQSFPEFLAKTGISLLVSTYQAGKLIMLRHQKGVLNTHFIDMEKPMGIALQDTHLAVGSAYQVAHYYNMPDAAPKIEPLNTHDACYLPREMHITGNVDIHEMAFTQDKELWLVNTKMSCLCTLSPEHSVIPRWRPPFISAYDLSDRCHLNGLAMRDGEPRYVSALGTTDTSAGWRKDKAAGGMLMDIRDNRMVASGLSMPHSPRWYQDKLWVLESGAGSLATVDIETGILTTIVELPGFTRGLDFIGRYAIIGLSQVRETAVFAGLPLTERCDKRQCGVYIIDIIEKQVVAYVVFSGDVQEIFSVQILPSLYPAVLSQDDPLLRTSYSLPDEALNELGEIDPLQIQLEEANVLQHQGDTQKAIETYKNLLKGSPNNTRALLKLGMIYLDSAQWQQASETFQRLIYKDPNHAEACNSLGLAWNGLKQWNKAETCFEQAISIDRQYAMAHVNLAFVLLRQGQFKEGWQELEWRWQVPGIKPLNCTQPVWRGENIANKTLLVHTEQSDSDIIQFARFLPLLKQASSCQHLIVLCSEPFWLFFKNIEGVDEVRLPDQVQADSFDVYAPIMSLPHILGITLESLSVKTPYWAIPQEVIVTNVKTNKRLKVGLVWNGQIGETNQLDDFLQLTKQDDIAFYNLQPQTTREEKDLLKTKHVIDLETELISYAHAGAIIQQLDLVICVDSPLAHLSASLGKPTWVLLGENPDWRWMNEREDSLWYPQMILFRPHINEKVTQLIQKVTDLLKKY